MYDGLIYTDIGCVRNDTSHKTKKIEKEIEDVKEQKLLEKIRKIVREELKKETETEDVDVVRVGDVRKDGLKVYVVTSFHSGSCYDPTRAVDIVYTTGEVVACCDVDNVKNDELLARYDNWRDAIASEEFKNE